MCTTPLRVRGTVVPPTGQHAAPLLDVSRPGCITASLHGRVSIDASRARGHSRRRCAHSHGQNLLKTFRGCERAFSTSADLHYSVGTTGDTAVPISGTATGVVDGPARGLCDVCSCVPSRERAEHLYINLQPPDQPRCRPSPVHRREQSAFCAFRIFCAHKQVDVSHQPSIA